MIPAIEVLGLTCAYDRVPVMEELFWKMPEGAFVGIIGPSGAGKTTLLKTLLGLLTPVKGEVRVFGESVRRPPPAVGYVPQVTSLPWDFPVTVEQAVMMGRIRAMRRWPWPCQEDRSAVRHILDRLGLAGLADRPLQDLSGGEQQRAILARALISRPRLLILDEPTADVDVKTQHEILHLLGELNHQGITILLTTHDLNSVAAHLPQVVCFHRRIVAEGPPHQIFTTEVLRETYQAEVTVIRHGDFILMASATPLSLLPSAGPARTPPPLSAPPQTP